MEWTFTIDGIEAFASTLMGIITNQPEKVLALHGNMGAGKTTLTTALLKVLGSADVINSPTFSIINEYKDAAGKPVYHMDWYRLKDEEEAIQAGVEDLLYSGCLCVIEWPEKAPLLLPDDTLHGYLTVKPTGERQFTLAW